MPSLLHFVMNICARGAHAAEQQHNQIWLRRNLLRNLRSLGVGPILNPLCPYPLLLGELRQSYRQSRRTLSKRLHLCCETPTALEVLLVAARRAQHGGLQLQGLLEVLVQEHREEEAPRRAPRGADRVATEGAFD